jgi:prepilin peptidase CpaA
LHYLVPVLGTGLFTIAAYGDVRSRRIPNALVTAVAALGLMRLAAVGDFAAAFATLTAAAIVLIAGFLLFWRRLIGGGDAKLMAASVIVVGHQALTSFLLAMALAGLVVTLAVLAADRLARRPVPSHAGSGPGAAPRRTVPYGVAIAAGAILTLLTQIPL